MDVREMKPGRELDMLVAEKVMGCYRNGMGIFVNREGCYRSEIPNYSTDISAAWKVVEKIKRKEIRGWGDIRLIWGNYGPGTTPKGPCGAMVYPNELAWICVIEQDVKGKSEFVSFAAETAPHAICIASLLATEDKA